MYVAFAHTFSPYYTLHNYVPCVMFFAKTMTKRDTLRKMRQKVYMPQTRRDCMMYDNWCLVNAGFTHIAFNAANITKMSTFQSFCSVFCTVHYVLSEKTDNELNEVMSGVCTRTLLEVGTVHCVFIYLINVLHCILYFALQFSVRTFGRLQCLDAWKYWWRRSILFLTKSMIFLLNWHNCYTQRVSKKRGGPTIFVFLIFNGWLLHCLKTHYFFTVVYTE